MKITSYCTGKVVSILSGHRRTPWVVRFHPRNPVLLASGSLDHEVRLWDASTGKCLIRHTFGKPIASLAFHATIPILAIACGHKLYIWEYRVQGSSPTIVLRTRRSMRAVHFHPHGLPLVLTAEVQDPSPTSSLTESLTEEGPFDRCTISRCGPKSKSRSQQCESISIESENHASQSSDSIAAEALDGKTKSYEFYNELNNTWPYSSILPPALVSVGWEVPFPISLPSGYPETESYGRHLEAIYNASVWNILGEEQPPRVHLRLFHFDPMKPSAELDEEGGVRLSIPDAVLCSEMGVHFSHCGRFIAATLACRAPMPEKAQDAAAAAMAAAGANVSQVNSVVNSDMPQDSEPMDWTATESSLPALRSERVVFEVRIFSLDGDSLGETHKSFRIRAAHCLTSVQFSPCGKHVLLAYGKKHSSLLRSLIVAEEGALIPLHTILEIFDLSGMQIVGVLPSSEDEINAACFHPFPGGGIAYGTKEGKLRILSHAKGENINVQQNNMQHVHPNLSGRLLQQLQDLGALMAASQGSSVNRSNILGNGGLGE